MSRSMVVPGCGCRSSARHDMRVESFTRFSDQKEHFIEAIKECDPDLWFPSDRGSLQLEKPGNWFVSFVPNSWGHWKGKMYGVHFAFIYARSRKGLPEGMRLAVGVEKPMRESERQLFKESVIARIEEKGLLLTNGITIQATPQKKLLDSGLLPFADDPWRVAIERYVRLRPVVAIIAEKMKEFHDRGAFDTLLTFP